MSAGHRGLWLGVGVVTGILLGVLVMVVALVAPRRDVPLAPSASAGLAAAADAAVRGFFGAESDFLATRARLLEALEERRHSIAPQTLAIFLDNLQLIDQSIVELAAAHAENPDHPRLSRLLAAACQREIELLQRAAELAGSRGAAQFQDHGAVQ